VTGGCEAYTARKQAAKIQLRNRIVADADAVMRAEGCTRTAARVRTYGAAGVSSSGHVSTGISQEPKRARYLLPSGEVPAAKGDRRQPWMGGEQSYRLIVPVKVENRRAPVRGGHGIHWREGGARGDASGEGTIAETQNSDPMSP